MKLKHLKHNQIDFEKWDYAVANSRNPIFYNSSWFLNSVSPNWEALVDENYSVIFPLTVKRILGVKFIVQPRFSQQIRLLYSNSRTCEQESDQGLKLPFALFNLQSNHKFNGQNSVNERPNLIIPLNENFEEIEKQYNQNCKRNIKKAISYNLRLDEFFDSHFFIDYALKNAPHTFSEKDSTVLKKIIDKSLDNKCGKIVKVTDEEGDVLSVGFFISQFGRITFLSGYSSPKGFEKRSMFFLMNEMIKSSVSKEQIFDFEGGAVEGVAKFYRGFGAIEEPFYVIENRFLKKLYDFLKNIKK